MEELLAEIDRNLRRAADGGYDERLHGIDAAGWAAQRLARRLVDAGARPERGLLPRLLTIPIVGGCVPQCCNASSVRMRGVHAHVDVLRAFARVDPDAAVELPREVVERLFAVDSRRIAMAAAELFARSPAAVVAHLEVVRVALDHPRWQVGLGLVQGLARAPAPRPRAVTQLLERATRHPEPRVRAFAERALGAARLSTSGRARADERAP